MDNTTKIDTAAASSGVSDVTRILRLVDSLDGYLTSPQQVELHDELLAAIRGLAAPAPVVPAREEWLRERAQLRKQITDLERIKHDLEGRLFDALKTDKWLAEGLEEVDHAPNISRGVYSKVLDVACVAVARVKELEASPRIDADKLHREIVGWVRDEDGTTGEPAFLRGPARPPRDYRGNYRPVIYETDACHAAAELVSDALGGGDTVEANLSAISAPNAEKCREMQRKRRGNAEKTATALDSSRGGER